MKNIKTAVLTIIGLFLFAQSPSAMEKADLIYSGGITGSPLSIIDELPLGHAGIFGGTVKENGRIVSIIYDCVPNYFKPGGVRKVKWKEFTHHFKYPMYGNRTTRIRPTARQRDIIIQAAISKLGRSYSDSHMSQKGPVDFDCVGYAEYAYETAGLNPTPDALETGAGWPLTPAEQFENTVVNQVIPPPSLTAAPKSAAGDMDLANKRVRLGILMNSSGDISVGFTDSEILPVSVE